MKIVVLLLSGESDSIFEHLGTHYPNPRIECITRNDIEKKSFFSRIRTVRALRPDVFAVATERVGWQRAQTIFMLLGALSGASRVLLLDPYGELREETGISVLLRTPFRLAHEALTSVNTLRRARRELHALESELQTRSSSAVVHLPGQSNNSERSSRNRPSIVYLRATPAPGTQVGGAATHVSGVVKAFLALGVKVRFISNDVIAGLDCPGMSLSVMQPESVGLTRAIFDMHNNFVFTRQAVPAIQAETTDFIYQRYVRFGWAGVVASWQLNRPLFLEYNGSEVWVGRNWDRVGSLKLLERYERLNLAAAARIFVVSEVERRNLVRAGVATEKIIVNPNGVDTELFRPDVGGDVIRQQLNIGTEETVVGFVGTFGPWHGVLTLAEAINLIPSNLPVCFLFVGSGSLRTETENMLRSENNLQRAIFAGVVDHQRVPAFLDACDVLVSPHVPLANKSEFFGSPTKLFEYMAMGKGIVATRLGQICEVLTDGETALLVEPGNARQLADGIMRLSESIPLRNRLGAAAREAAIAHHTWKRNAQNVIDAYHAWLKRSE